MLLWPWLIPRSEKAFAWSFATNLTSDKVTLSAPVFGAILFKKIYPSQNESEPYSLTASLDAYAHFAVQKKEHRSLCYYDASASLI